MSDIEPVTAPAASHDTVSADMIGAVTKVDRSIKVRRENDGPLINYWLYFFLLSWITLGIYSLVLFFKRITRIDAFSERKRDYYESVLEWTQRHAESKGRRGEVEHLINDTRQEVRTAFDGDLRPIRAGLALLLSIVTLGLYGIYVLYRENRFWWDAQKLEQDFDDKLSQMWTTLGITKYPINFTVDTGKNRNFALYFILSIVTLGVWGIVWDYKIHTDPDKLYSEYHGIEDTVLATIRTV